MKRGKRLGVIAIVSTILVLTMTQSASATLDWVDISIDHAYYYDLDADGVEDDVQINFTCTVRDHVKSPSKSEYYVYLKLPSVLT